MSDDYKKNAPATATGFQVTNLKNWSNFEKKEFKLKPFEDDDVDIAIDACGVCASDVHTISGGWSEDVPLPLCVGHEVIGRVVGVGKNVKQLKRGDRVGVGAQIGADLTCNQCKNDQENYCPNQIDTYGAPYPDGTVSQGGYASHIRAHQYFTFKIPDGLDTVNAAPMLCAGLTSFAPLKRLGAGPGKNIGIVGLGGLGHYAVLWGLALGAEVSILSHSASKKTDAHKFEVQGKKIKDFIITGEKDWSKPYAFNFDFIVCTADVTLHLPDYFSTLKVGGHFHLVGFPDNELPAMNAQAFAGTGNYMGASHIGNRPEMEEMLQLAADKNIKSWVQPIPISAEGCKKAVEGVHHGGENGPRFRYTLTNFDEAFGARPT